MLDDEDLNFTSGSCELNDDDEKLELDDEDEEKLEPELDEIDENDLWLCIRGKSASKLKNSFLKNSADEKLTKMHKIVTKIDKFISKMLTGLRITQKIN